MTSHRIYSARCIWIRIWIYIYIEDDQTEGVSIEVACQSVSATGSDHTRSGAASVDNSVVRVYRFDKPHGMIVLSAPEHIDIFVL
jgi:hypothetical protein